MTEKQYGMSNESGAFIDKKFNKEYTDDEIIDLLNELSEENEQLKKEIGELNHDLDLYEENNTNEVLNNLRIELISRMNDCIEEFKE